VTGRAQPFLGHDGAITLVAALLAAALTLGIAPLLAMRAVARTARQAGTTPADPPAVILVLGHRLEAGAVSPVFAARLDRALALARASPGARVLVLGGQTTPGGPAEAEAGRVRLVAQGLDPARIGIETRSRHTLENLANYRDAHPGAPPAALVTSRTHLYRALLMARGFGLSPCAGGGGGSLLARSSGAGGGRLHGPLVRDRAMAVAHPAPAAMAPADRLIRVKIMHRAGVHAVA
jgi:uncharacterized SAM-binding protein YcdF (DUF218 family)